MSPEALENSVWRLLDGDLPPEEFADLERFLEESPEARARFVKQVDLHNLLGQKLALPHSLETLHRGVVPVGDLLTRQKRKALRYSTFAAAAVLLLLGVLLRVVLLRDPEPMLTFRTSEDTVLSVSHLTGNDQEPEPGTLEKGSRLVLSQGAVELTFANGVTSVVQAPADLTLQREDRIYQNYGIARYQVPREAIGFQVQTPDLLVTDLGTEFGVISTPEALDEVHVFKGTVEARNNRGLQNTEVITSRVARIAGPAGRLKPTPLRPTEFLDSLPASIPHLHFSFDSMVGKNLAVEGDQPDVPAISAWFERGKAPPAKSPLVAGKFGNALRLSGTGDHIRTDWPGIPGRNPRTVAFWIRLPKDQPDNRLKGILVWGDTHVSGGKFSVNWNSIPKCGQLGALRFDCGEGYVVGETDLRDDRWHHVAVVFGGPSDPTTRMKVQLYVDGLTQKPTGSLFADPNTLPGGDADTWMSIGRFFDVDIKERGTLTAELDELYIFSGILAPESIKRLMHTGW